MTNTYFKVFGQRAAAHGKFILVMVLDEDCIAPNLPEQFEMQAIKIPATIYTGTYPQIKLNTDTITPTPEHKGAGINGVITSMDWYCVKREIGDPMKISTNNP